MVHIGTYWCILVHFGAYWCILVQIAAHCCILVHIGAYWKVLRCHHVLSILVQGVSVMFHIGGAYLLNMQICRHCSSVLLSESPSYAQPSLCSLPDTATQRSAITDPSILQSTVAAIKGIDDGPVGTICCFGDMSGDKKMSHGRKNRAVSMTQLLGGTFAW